MKGLGLLNAIERAGNRLPHPAILFVYLCAIVPLLSGLLGVLGVRAITLWRNDTVGAIAS